MLLEHITPRCATTITNPSIPRHTWTTVLRRTNTAFCRSEKIQRYNFDSLAPGGYCYVGCYHFLFDNLREKRSVPLTQYSGSVFFKNSCGTEVKNHCYTNTLLSFTILSFTILYYTILYYTILYYTILYYTTLYYIILYYPIPHYTVLHYTILYYTTLHYTILLLCYSKLGWTNKLQKSFSNVEEVHWRIHF